MLSIVPQTFAQTDDACVFNDTYWNIACPNNGFKPGCHRWHLIDEDPPIADIRVCPVWDLGYTGAGFTIGMVDLGVRITHEDLSGRYNATASGVHCSQGSTICWGHATGMAALAVGSANNVGIVGVAHGAMFSEIPLIADCPCVPRAVSPEEIAAALVLKNNLNDIKTASIGRGGVKIATYKCSGGSDCVVDAIEQSALTGRAGLGTIFVFSAGNDGHAQGRSDYDRMKSHRQTIAIGVIRTTTNTHAQATREQASLLLHPGAILQ